MRKHSFQSIKGILSSETLLSALPENLTEELCRKTEGFCSPISECENSS